MKKPIALFKKPSIIIAPLLLAACASEPPAPAPRPMPVLSSDKIYNESQGMAHLSNRLKSNKQLIEQGNVMVREGQMKIDEGNRMIGEGRKIKMEAEESYRNIKN